MATTTTTAAYSSSPTSSTPTPHPPWPSSASPPSPTSASSLPTTAPSATPPPWTSPTSPASPTPWPSSSSPAPASPSAPSSAPPRSPTAAAPVLIRRLLRGRTLAHDPRAWAAAAVSVYFFAVSGAMHGIIGGTPLLYASDRADSTRPIFFHRGSSMQLGAEGFAVGLLYAVAGFAIASVTHAVVRMRNAKVQRICMAAAYSDRSESCFEPQSEQQSVSGEKHG